MVVWTSSLSIGVKHVDEQHKSLILKLNHLLESCAQKKGIEEIESTMFFLKEYVIYHFKDEELLMKESNYELYDKHRESHLLFINEINQLEKDVQRYGPGILTSAKMNRILIQWFERHIKKDDKHFAEYYNSIEK